VSEPAVSLHFFDPEHGLSGSARSGATLLFEGSGSSVLPEGPTVTAGDGGWSAQLEGAFELSFEPVVAPAELDGVSAHFCAVTGQVGGQRVSCFGTVAQTHAAPSWDELDAVRSIAALFDRDNAFLAIGRRPRGAIGHDQEQTTAWLLHEGVVIPVEDARISTVYDGEGRQRSAGLELWVPGEDYPVRGSGTVVAGSSLKLEGVDVHAAVFRWRMEDREGSGAYEVMARAVEPQAA
jgi:hypothetical protein